jgi:hypothetical protein
MAASFPALAGQQAGAIDAWRVVVGRPGQGVLAEEAGAVGPEQSSITVAVTVTLEAACEVLLVRIELSSSGEVWYRAEREQQVCAGTGNQVPSLQLEWVGPTIGLTPTQLSFSADQATNPSSQTFLVTNAGGGTLRWDASEDAAWLSLSPTSGILGAGASQTVTATITSNNLEPGQFESTIVVTDPNAANSPRTLPVSLAVIEVTNSVIRGTVSAEGTGLGGVAVSITGKEAHSATTNASGQFEFAGLTSGSYTVTISGFPADVSFATTARSISPGVNQTVTADFQGTYIRTSGVRGAVTASGSGLSGVTVSLTGTEFRSTTTDASGGYSFTGLRAGAYTVSISNLPVGSVFQTTSTNTSVNVGETVVVDFTGEIIQLPSAEYSYIEACPAVIPRDEEVGWRTLVTVGVRDQFSTPIQGATVLLSESPKLGECSPFPPLEDSFLITGPNGLAFTGYNSCWDYTGPMTFTAQITANSSTIIVQESDDLYVDVHRWDYSLSRYSGNGQAIAAGQSGLFEVRVLSAEGGPVQGVRVGWDVEGGNCLHNPTNASGIAGISLYVPPSTAPGLYRITANIAAIDWYSEPWTLVNVVFTYQVVDSATAPSAVISSPEAPRLRGTPLAPGGE